MSIDMRGIEIQHIPKKVEELSHHQRALYDAISFPRKMKVLYRVLQNDMPESSVRRVMYFLRDNNLARKMDSGKWLRI